MKEIFTMIQRNKSHKEGFVFANGLIKTNKSIQEIKDIFYDAWDTATEELNAVAREIEITNKNSSEFAKCDIIADIELIHVPDDKEELYSSSDILMKYIEQNIDFVNNLEVLTVINVSNEENIQKGISVKELNVVLTKGEETYIYYELNVDSGSRKYSEGAIGFVCSILD